MAKQAGSAVQQGVGQANAAIGAVTERTGQVAERTGEVLGNFRSAVETSARSQPTTTVLLAALAGFAFGALWRMGRGRLIAAEARPLRSNVWNKRAAARLSLLQHRGFFLGRAQRPFSPP